MVLVLRADRTRTNAARRVAELLRQYRANVLGVVLNSCDRSEMNQYYGYGYGYGYGYLGKAGSKTKPGRGDPATTRTPAPADDGNAEGRPYSGPVPDRADDVVVGERPDPTPTGADTSSIGEQRTSTHG